MKSTTGAFHILKAGRPPQPGRRQPDKAAVQQTHARHILIKVTPTMTAADAKRKLA